MSHLSLFDYLNIKPQHTLELNFFSINNLSNVGVPDECKNFQNGKTDLCMIRPDAVSCDRDRDRDYNESHSHSKNNMDHINGLN